MLDMLQIFESLLYDLNKTDVWSNYVTGDKIKASTWKKTLSTNEFKRLKAVEILYYVTTLSLNTSRKDIAKFHTNKLWDEILRLKLCSSE